MMPSLKTRDAAIIFFGALFLFTAFLNPEFINFDARFGLFAKMMIKNGVSLFPMTYLGPYPDYPVFPTLLIYLVAKLFGELTTLAGVLPSALAASGTLVVVYLLGALRSRNMGLMSVFILMFTYNYVAMARSTSIDHFITFFTALGFYLTYSADQLKRTKRLLLIPLVLILGFAMRGLIGLIIPGSVIFFYYLLNSMYRKCIVFSVIAVLVGVGCMAGLLALAYRMGGKTFVDMVLNAEIFSRVAISARNSCLKTYWLGGLTRYFMAYPFAIMVIFSRFKQLRNPQTEDGRLLRMLAVWILVIMVGMSVPSTHKARYILPVVPACALLASRFFLEPDTAGWQTEFRIIFLRVVRLLPYLLFALSVTGFFVRSQYPVLGYIRFIPLGMASLLLILATRRWISPDVPAPSAGMRQLAFGALAMNLFVICVENPVRYASEETRPFVDSVMQIKKAVEKPLCFYQVGPDGPDIKFMLNTDLSFQPLFATEPDELLARPGSACFITYEKIYDQMPEHLRCRLNILARGKIGHKECLLFMVKPEVPPRLAAIQYPHPVARPWRPDKMPPVILHLFS